MFFYKTEKTCFYVFYLQINVFNIYVADSVPSHNDAVIERCECCSVADAGNVVYSYRLRIEALLLKEEFNQTVDWLKPSIDSVIISARGSSVKFYFAFFCYPSLHNALSLSVMSKGFAFVVMASFALIDYCVLCRFAELPSHPRHSRYRFASRKLSQHRK